MQIETILEIVGIALGIGCFALLIRPRKKPDAGNDRSASSDIGNVADRIEGSAATVGEIGAGISRVGTAIDTSTGEIGTSLNRIGEAKDSIASARVKLDSVIAGLEDAIRKGKGN
jgi:hypothetical protein